MLSAMSADDPAADRPIPAPASGPRGPYRTGVRRRQEIVETAIRVFGQHGYAGSSLRMIAEGVGVSPPALVRHFGSKEALFAAVLEASDRSHAASIGEPARGLAYLRGFAAAVTTNARHRGMVELLLTVATEASDPSHPAHPFMVRRYRDLVASLAAALRHAVDAGEIEPMSEAAIEAEARGVAALMDGLELQWLLDPGIDLVGLYGHHYERLVDRWTGAGRDAGTTTRDGSVGDAS